MSKDDRDINIIAFLCNWCAYEGADAAGRARALYSPYVKVVRVMCSGRVDPYHVFQAFQRGADGVMILGCHLGDCHYKDGNYRLLGRYEFLKRVLPEFGIPKERLWLGWMSAGEHDVFVDAVSGIARRIQELNLERKEPAGLERALSHAQQA